MKEPKLLITGSNGVVGQVLWKGLEDDYELYGLDRQGAPKGMMFQADISNLAAVMEILEQVRPEFVIHLAGDAKPGAGWESILENNIIGTHNIYKASKEHAVRRIILASSNRVTSGYEKDLPAGKKISPSDPVRPECYYATSKVFGEALARQFYELYHLESICLRLGLVLKSGFPARGRQEAVWLSHRDLVQVVRKSLQAPIGYGVYYAISGNKSSLWDLSATVSELGYCPRDDPSRISLLRRTSEKLNHRLRCR